MFFVQEPKLDKETESADQKEMFRERVHNIFTKEGAGNRSSCFLVWILCFVGYLELTHKVIRKKMEEELGIKIDGDAKTSLKDVTVELFQTFKL